MGTAAKDDTATSRYRSAELALWRENGVQPREVWVDVPDLGVAVRVLEVGNGPPTLFVHGVTTSGTSWATLASRLPNRRCLVLDRPGCGLSQRLPSDRLGSLSPLVDIQIAVLDALAVDAADVVGNSLGGACVLSLAQRAPERVRRIVLSGAPAIAGIKLTLPLRLVASGPLGRALVRRHLSAADIRWSVGQWGHRRLLAAGWPRGAWLRWALAASNDTGTARNETLTIQSLANWRDWRHERLLDPAALPGINQRTLWLWGRNDPIATVEQGRAWAASMPRASFEVLDAGHLPWLDQPELHVRRIDAYLDEQ